MLLFYDAPISGNTWKVRLLLAQLALPHEVVRLDIMNGAVRTPEFRKLNPFGRVPYIVEDGFALAESNAILLYLARGSRLLPEEARAQALIQQWMFFEQNQVELAIGIPRYLRQRSIEAPGVVEHYLPRAAAALKVLDRHLARGHLAQRQWLVGEAYSIADIAVCGYAQLAEEAGHSLADYPAVSAWLARVRQEPGFFALE